MEKIGKLFRQFAKDYIGQNLEGINCLFIIEYSGIKAPQMSVLRQSLNFSQANLLVVKNSICHRVFDSLGLAELSKMLQGPCGIVFGKGDPIDVSKTLYNFTKSNENLKIEGGLLKEKVLTRADIIALASLPSKEMLYAKVASSFKSPMRAIVWTLSGMLKKLVYVLEQIKQKK